MDVYVKFGDSRSNSVPEIYQPSHVVMDASQDGRKKCHSAFYLKSSSVKMGAGASVYVPATDPVTCRLQECYFGSSVIVRRCSAIQCRRLSAHRQCPSTMVCRCSSVGRSSIPE